jgi:creatinine amidohydrolase
MGDIVNAGKLTWYEFEKRVREEIVFLPIGSTEQHGPHLPLNVDRILPTRICERIAGKDEGIVLPPVAYGGRSQTESGGGPTFPGTTDIRGQTLLNLLKDIFEEIEADGGERIFVMNGHLENEYFTREAIDQFLMESDVDVQFLFGTWLTFISQKIQEEVFQDFPGGYPGDNQEHAGVLETSAMLHFEPSLVDMDAIDEVESPRSTPYRLKPAPDDTIPRTGLFIDPSSVASAAVGEKVVDDVVENATDAIETELK